MSERIGSRSWKLPSRRRRLRSKGTFGTSVAGCLLVIGLMLLSVNTICGQIAADLQWADDLVNTRMATAPTQRTQLTAQLVDRLAKYRNSSRDVSELLDTLELFADLARFDSGSLSQTAQNVQAARNRTDQLIHLQKWRLELLARTTALILPTRPDKMTPAEAQRLAELVRYTSQAIDDIRDPELMGGKSTDLTKLLTRLDGIAKLGQSIEDPQARRIVSGLRGTLGTIEKRLNDLGVSVPNAMRAFDLPAEIAGAIVDTSRKGMDQTSAALEDVSKAINGDTEALVRIGVHAKSIEQTLSPATYGRAMMKAMSDRLVDRVPFARTLAKLFAPPAAAGKTTDAAGAKVVQIEARWSGQKSILNEDDVFECAPNPNRRAYGEVNGTDRYSVVSGVCRSAIHAGIITFERGGRFRLRFFAYDPAWKPVSTVRYGITSDGFDWSSLRKGTFVVLRAD